MMSATLAQVAGKGSKIQSRCGGKIVSPLSMGRLGECASSVASAMSEAARRPKSNGGLSVTWPFETTGLSLWVRVRLRPVQRAL